MQAIAAEFNLAETTFVLPPKDPAHTAEVRIFTPRYEMPFAGHPNVGTAFALARAGQSYGRTIDGERVVFEEKAGLVPITILKDGPTVTGARLASPQPLAIGAEVPTELIAAACSLSVDDIETRHHRPCIASCGAPFILAELKTREKLGAARGRPEVFEREVAKLPVTSLFIYTQVSESDLDIRARMFAPHHGIPEDPATGSANVALVGLLAHLRPERDLRISKRIAQGVEMGRPSLLQAEAVKEDGIVTATMIGGRCVPVMSGRINLI
jgi:trans-2,3-dihydro-3-hydroxyanthranilate isomerase